MRLRLSFAPAADRCVLPVHYNHVLQGFLFVLHYRRKHPGASKETIKPELDAYCARHGVRTVSVSTIGRLSRT